MQPIDLQHHERRACRLRRFDDGLIDIQLGLETFPGRYPRVEEAA